MAKATYKRGEVRTVKYTTGAEETVGVDDILMLGVVATKKGRIGVAREAIPAASTGLVAISGVFEFPKVAAAVIKAGESVTWDAEADTNAIEDNAHGPEAADPVEICMVQFGTAMHDAAATTTVIDVDISRPGVYTVGAGL